ncbi:hypothetical protein M8818_001401 [Zalaria obscura]|uniref:Uncharacterized protein n=1 Tax=Zalaria obscura TaxID=2024903 RepID=A0ACC3SK79_9PEZI
MPTLIYEYERGARLGDGSIRLLKLHPGAVNDPLEAHFVVKPLISFPGSDVYDDNPDSIEPYTALSYSWGPVDRAGGERYIKIFTGDDVYHIAIRSNLESALYQLRHTDKTTFFWIDALCNNQANKREKSLQIPLMGQIYANAKDVCVWLGVEEANSNEAIQLIKDCCERGQVECFVYDESRTRAWAALSSLMRRSWFGRRWILQEIVFARQASLHCGSANITWEEFECVISLLPSKAEQLKTLFRRSVDFDNHPDFLGDLNELAAVRLAQSFERLLEGNAPAIEVNYEKSVFEVYKDFLRHTFHSSNSLDILCKPWTPNDPHGLLPSWIPQLSGRAFGPDIRGVYRRIGPDALGTPKPRMRLYRASMNLRAQWKFKASPDRILIVHGFVLDVIKENGRVASAGCIPSSWAETVGWMQQSRSPPDYFWRTLVGNRTSEGHKAHPHWRKACHTAFDQKPTGGDLDTGEMIMYDNCPDPVKSFLRRAQCVVWSRRLVLLERLEQPKSIGLASKEAKKGDLICILYGCSSPVTLRKLINNQPAPKGMVSNRGANCQHIKKAQDSSSGLNGEQEFYYQFIGECYVHEMMDGQAFGIKNRGDTFLVAQTTSRATVDCYGGRQIRSWRAFHFGSRIHKPDRALSRYISAHCIPPSTTDNEDVAIPSARVFLCSTALLGHGGSLRDTHTCATGHSSPSPPP